MMRRTKGHREEEASYFTYRPLSNLPTPPPTSRKPSLEACPAGALVGGNSLNNKFLGPAIHLANLVPASASPLATPSVPLVQAILTRSNLPIDTVALAVCILDSLDSKKFARRWRSSCPLIEDQTGLAPATSPYLLLPPSPSASPPPTPDEPGHARHHSRTASQTHIDSVRPEVIIVAALVIANKFFEDPQDRADYYCRVWAGDMWSCPQLNATERCLMEALDYRIMPLCDPDLLEDAKADMHFAAVYHGEDEVDDDDAWAGGRYDEDDGWDVPRDMMPAEQEDAPVHVSVACLESMAAGLGLGLHVALDGVLEPEIEIEDEEEYIEVSCVA